MDKRYLALAILSIPAASIIGFVATHSFYSGAANSTSNVFAAASLFPTPTPPPLASTLVINEILPASSCVDGNKTVNWIELWNGTSGTVNLQGFKISDGTNITDLVNSSTTIASHQFALIAKDGSIFNHGTSKGNKCYADNNAVTANLGNSSPVVFTTGVLRLLQSDGTTVIDRVQFNGTFDGQNLSAPTDQSIERKITGQDSAIGDTFNGQDFVIRTTPTPGL